ncbi:MAG TPA: TdeIII family type II restriction endonuclease, partial [Methylomirabilota bacterium]|nr:TdeIII family type II restriction endonuclease [Methylomirabilota bacterium]
MLIFGQWQAIAYNIFMQNSAKITNKEVIQLLVQTAIENYAQGFQTRHEIEYNDPDGTINMKIHNVFIAALGPELQYYNALVRSLDSSLGNMLEKLAMSIAKLSFEVHKSVEGPLTIEQTQQIAELLEKYKRHEKKPTVTDYQFLRAKPKASDLLNKRHDSDYYLIQKETQTHCLIELKIGGDLDNKKARSEKEAILEQFAILSNVLAEDTRIEVYFATAYNRFGEGKTWQQERVKQFFASEELLIGKDFWNFICQSD